MGGSSKVDRLTFCRIANEFNKDIMALVQDGDTVKLPEKMGAIFVRGKKVVTEYDEELGRISNQSIDFGETNKLWARCPECKEKKLRVYHENEHSDGVRYRYFWSKDRMAVENKLFYTMVFTRHNKRTLAAMIKQGKEYYVEPEKYKL